jgi:hypothetical protein
VVGIVNPGAFVGHYASSRFRGPGVFTEVLRSHYTARASGLVWLTQDDT